MILIKYAFKRFRPRLPYCWYSVVKCEECHKERAVRTDSLKNLHPNHLCKSCNQKGERNDMFGKHGYFLGKHLSIETKMKISLANKGKKQSPESIEKRISKIRGEKNCNWNPNRTREQRQQERKLSENTNWTKCILKRDNHTCQITGQIGGDLCVHHLNGWRDFPEQRLDVYNGITLSKNIHKLFHCIYGQTHNTKEQFEQFNMYMFDILDT